MGFLYFIVLFFFYTEKKTCYFFKKKQHQGKKTFKSWASSIPISATPPLALNAKSTRSAVSSKAPTPSSWTSSAPLAPTSTPSTATPPPSSTASNAPPSSPAPLVVRLSSLKAALSARRLITKNKRNQNFGS